MTVDRCVCTGKTFVELKKIAEEKGSQTVDDLRRHVVFGTGCQLCLPYVDGVIRTGETSFRWIPIAPGTPDNMDSGR
jgi:bacterioferritin-associated ferredoxin